MEIEELVKQVKILSDTVNAQSERLDIVFRTMDETTKALKQTSEILQQSTENLATTNEALLKSLDESDAQLDDLAKVTAALLTLQKQEGSQQEPVKQEA